MESLPHIYSEKLSNGYTFEMRLIPEGVFDMGSTDADTDAINDEKSLRIGFHVAPFYLAPYAVTQALWKAVMGEENNPSRFKGDQHPVEMISWDDTKNFMEALNAETKNKRDALGLGEYRLPTEAEWEYAARGGALDAGYLYSGSDKLKEVGWYEANSDGETHEVGLLMPNQLGLYDMSGNVWEWVEDHWHDYYEGAPKDSRAWLDSGESASRHLRGGSYFVGPLPCRSAHRNNAPPDSRAGNLGFRLALAPSLGQSIPAIP